MNKKIFLKLMLINIALFSNLNYGQNGDTDWESWGTIGVEYNLKKWEFNLEQQYRLKENFSETDSYFTQFGVEYEMFKNFKLGAAARFISFNDNVGAIQGYEDHFRFQFDGSYKHKIKNLELGYRLRYQNKNELGISTDDGDNPKHTFRFKTSLEYDFKNWKLDPKVSAEIFNRYEEDGDVNTYNKYRFTIGTDYKVKKIGKFGLFYRYEKEMNVDLPEVTNIIGLKYIYTIK
ncbi:DUF2490 domain-containing protein [Polaribacter sp. Asnod1-A03]|uniref:DUF2490 domain-containing protein n=1 Tax=Polaribacter sp. Asnod1-A03 TaxID=3160581 RepID=UPI0038656793